MVKLYTRWCRSYPQAVYVALCRGVPGPHPWDKSNLTFKCGPKSGSIRQFWINKEKGERIEITQNQGLVYARFNFIHFFSSLKLDGSAMISILGLAFLLDFLVSSVYIYISFVYQAEQKCVEFTLFAWYVYPIGVSFLHMFCFHRDDQRPIVQFIICDKKVNQFFSRYWANQFKTYIAPPRIWTLNFRLFKSWPPWAKKPFKFSTRAPRLLFKDKFF